MEHDTRRTGRSGRQNRLLIDLKVRSQTEIPPNVSMFGDDPAMYYLRDGRNAQRRSDLDRRISNEVELRRLHNVPAHLAESTQREMEGDRAGSHRIHSLITEGLTTSSHNLSVVSNTVGEKTAAASKVVKQFAKTSWKASKHQGRKVGDEIRSKTAPVIASVRHQLRSGSSSSDSHRTSPHTRVHILEAVPVAQHPAFLDGEKLAAVSVVAVTLFVVRVLIVVLTLRCRVFILLRMTGRCLTQRSRRSTPVRRCPRRPRPRLTTRTRLVSMARCSGRLPIPISTVTFTTLAG